MYKRLAAVIVLTVCAAATSYAAMSLSDLMHRRPGLWSLSVKMEGTKFTAPATTMCIDAATDGKMMEHSMAAQTNKACSPPIIAGMGATRTIDVACNVGGSPMKTHTVMTSSGDTAYHMESTVQFSKPVLGKISMRMSQDAKWTGPCPSGMKPGDMMINGMKFNVFDATPHMHMTKAQIDAMIRANRH